MRHADKIARPLRKWHDSSAICCNILEIGRTRGRVVASRIRDTEPRRPLWGLRESRFTNIDLVLLVGALLVAAVAFGVSAAAALGL